MSTQAAYVALAESSLAFSSAWALEVLFFSFFNFALSLNLAFIHFLYLVVLSDLRSCFAFLGAIDLFSFFCLRVSFFSLALNLASCVS